MQRMELIAPQFTASFHLCAVALSVHSLVGWFCYSFIHSLRNFTCWALAAPLSLTHLRISLPVGACTPRESLPGPLAGTGALLLTPGVPPRNGDRMGGCLLV